MADFRLSLSAAVWIVSSTVPEAENWRIFWTAASPLSPLASYNYRIRMLTGAQAGSFIFASTERWIDNSVLTGDTTGVAPGDKAVFLPL